MESQANTSPASYRVPRVNEDAEGRRSFPWLTLIHEVGADTDKQTNPFLQIPDFPLSGDSDVDGIEDYPEATVVFRKSAQCATVVGKTDRVKKLLADADARLQERHGPRWWSVVIRK